MQEPISIDARKYLKRVPELDTDVVYWNPMFPDDIEGHWLKEMQILQNFIGMDDDSDALLDLALSVAGQRVVINMP